MNGHSAIMLCMGALHGRAARLLSSDPPIGIAPLCERQRAAAELVAIARWLNGQLSDELRVSDEDMGAMLDALGLAELPEIELAGEDFG
jgi:hypothetical protein